jgi:hypothetical protein
MSVKIEDRGHETDCWVWQKMLKYDGYGQMQLSGTRRGKHGVHRVTYEEWVGPIPVGLEIDHLCRVRACCNPAHLEAVTQRVNAQREDHANSRKTHCPQRHEYTPTNIYLDKRGSRCCGEYRKAYLRAYHRTHYVPVSARKERTPA